MSDALPITATVTDTAYDLAAALEMYDGTFGSETTTIESVDVGERDSVVVQLSNGQQYRLQVREIRN